MAVISSFRHSSALFALILGGVISTVIASLDEVTSFTFQSASKTCDAFNANVVVPSALAVYV